MKDVRTKRGADIASDHHLVVANLKLKLKKQWTTGKTADLLNEEETSMEDNWKGVKEVITSTCLEVLGRNKHHHNEWISMKILHKIQERKNKVTALNNSRTRAEKVNEQTEYTEVNKQ
ncbi:unnamed protein product [Schistosoma margrebowiei]|uniref:Uncharacterized protein n=1 Tax=Schistosoma margrebowiei TaxID=48269 RepID=A0A183LPS4_9TREM|nr:unnamed protein product [Schistosoma margrebowiei]